MCRLLCLAAGAGAPGARRHRETSGRFHAENGGDDHLRHRRSDLDAGRCVTGRADDPVRPAGRSLHHADHRRQREAHHGRAVVRKPACLVAGRQDHRIPDGSHRGREPVDRQCGWLESARGEQGRAHQRRAPADGVAVVDARRQLHRGVEVTSARSGHLLAVHVSPRRRVGRARRGDRHSGTPPVPASPPVSAPEPAPVELRG